MSNSEYIEIMKTKGIKPSMQRAAVYGFLQENRIHPTAETIYAALKDDNPTLSLTTVYNTLKLFSEKGLVTAISLEKEQLRFDADTSPHSHFKCSVCGKVCDIINPKVFSKIRKQTETLLPEGFTSDSFQINIWGKCADCQ